MYLRLIIFSLVMFASVVSYAQSKYSVVEIRTVDKNGKKYHGTGFYIRSNVIVTAYHVISKRNPDKDITATGCGDVPVKVRLLKYSKIRDLAVLSIKGGGSMPFAICDSYRTSDPVYLLTYKNGKYIKKKGYLLYISNKLLRSSIPTRPGYSGSPIIKKHFVNKCIVGLHRLKGSYHIPAPVIRKFIKEALDE